MSKPLPCSSLEPLICLDSYMSQLFRLGSMVTLDFTYRRKIHKEGCQSSPWQEKLLVLSHVPPNLDLSIWSISTNLSYFFCLLLATGLVGFKWNLLHNLFHFDNAIRTCILNLYYLLYAGIGFWSPTKLSKMGETF